MSDDTEHNIGRHPSDLSTGIDWRWNKRSSAVKTTKRGFKSRKENCRLPKERVHHLEEKRQDSQGLTQPCSGRGYVTRFAKVSALH